MHRAIIPVSLLCAALAGCSSLSRREPQPELFISTVPPGAYCTVGKIGQPLAVIDSTPGIALLDPAQRELTVQCRRHAFEDAVATVMATPVGDRFNFAVAGRTAYEYPGTVTLVMTPKPPAAVR